MADTTCSCPNRTSLALVADMDMVEVEVDIYSTKPSRYGGYGLGC